MSADILVFVPLQVHMFVDATFDVVPSPFYQCLIIMVFDAIGSASLFQ